MKTELLTVYDVYDALINKRDKLVEQLGTNSTLTNEAETVRIFSWLVDNFCNLLNKVNCFVFLLEIRYAENNLEIISNNSNFQNCDLVSAKDFEKSFLEALNIFFKLKVFTIAIVHMANEDSKLYRLALSNPNCSSQQIS